MWGRLQDVGVGGGAGGGLRRRATVADAQRESGGVASDLWCREVTRGSLENQEVDMELQGGKTPSDVFFLSIISGYR